MAYGGTKFMLNTGANIPAIGLGVWQNQTSQEHAVTAALKAGYRHIDSAQVYNNERAIGRAIRKSSIPREELFITTKLWNNDHNPEDVGAALDRSLKHLGLAYVDLFLMHWPCSFASRQGRIPLDKTGRIRAGTADFVDTYKAMEDTVHCGKAKAIGISNFSRRELERLLRKCTIIPAVHRVELHPWLQQSEFVEFHKTKGIHISQYSPFGCSEAVYEGGKSLGKLIHDSRVIWIAVKYNKTPSQVVLAWGITNGHSVLPKSLYPSRIKSNLEGDFTLDDEDMRTLRGMDQKIRLNDPSERYGWNFFVGDDGKDQICPTLSSTSSTSSSSSRSSSLSRDPSKDERLASSASPTQGRANSPNRANSPDRSFAHLETLSFGRDIMDAN